MQINRLQVRNYSSFADSGKIDFKPGINFVVGQNNSGKSALLRSLTVLPNNPHKSEDEFRAERLQAPELLADISISGMEMETSWLRQNLSLVWPIPGQPGPDMKSAAEARLSFLLASRNIDLSITRDAYGSTAFQGIPPYAQSGQAAVFRPSVGGPIFQNWESAIVRPNLSAVIDNIWQTNIFSFNAQRYNVGRCAIQMQDRMLPDAANLPAVLMRLQGNQTDIFRQLTQHMRDIFSTIGNLSVTSPSGSAELEILVWATTEQVYPELSTSLNDSGTGLSQVLAILTIAMTMERSVIVIDEISSFLHPAAAKSLVRILEAHYPYHQYIISTHSPEVITACSPSTVHLVKKNGFRSSVTSIDVDDISDLRALTGELGVSMTDVFASDRIIWVEGPTEELCFPYLLEETRSSQDGPSGKRSLPQFTSVVATGDFMSNRTRPDLVFDIYDRLSRAAATLASAAAFAFDREELSEDEMKDLNRRGKNRVRFLPRRLIECYLLSPTAIAVVINAELGDGFTTDAAIEAAIKARGGNARYKAMPEWTGDIDDEKWLAKVDAAKLLKELFDQVSGTTLEFQKRKHSFDILKQMIAFDRPRLSGLIEFVEDLVLVASS